MKTSKTLTAAHLLWDFLGSHAEPAEADVIIVCCSYDLRVCDFACRLLVDSNATKILFSGNTGTWTRHLWAEPEALVFAEHAAAQGVPTQAILTEIESTNTGENILFSRRMLSDNTKVCFVTKPNTLLRVKLTVPVQWPAANASYACPTFSFPDEVSNVVGLYGVINEMVGDLQRILDYPKLGYQIPFELPSEVLEAMSYLEEEGFLIHSIRN